MCFNKEFIIQLFSFFQLYCDLILAKLLNKKIVIVYQMGKVGSTAIVRSLKSFGLYGGSIYHMHFLSQEGREYWKKSIEENYGTWNNAPLSKKIKLAQSYLLSQAINKGYLNSNNCKVVTLVREPIARNISGFFQINDWWIPELKIKLKDEATYSKEKSTLIKKLTQDFFERYWQHDLPLTWFEQEFMSVFGIDVFSSSFDFQNGYKIYKAERADVLLLKLENLDRCSIQAFRDFFNLHDFSLKKGNIGEKKWYSSIYKDFVSNVKIPDNYIEKMYQSKYSTHFYSPEEISSFKLKWRH